GVGVGEGVRVGVGVGAGVGLGVALGFAVGCAVVRGVVVGCVAPLLGRLVGELDDDGCRATGGCAAFCGPSNSDDSQRTNAPIPTHSTSRPSIDMSGSPPTHHYTAPPSRRQAATRNQTVT